MFGNLLEDKAFFKKMSILQKLKQMQCFFGKPFQVNSYMKSENKN